MQQTLSKSTSSPPFVPTQAQWPFGLHGFTWRRPSLLQSVALLIIALSLLPILYLAMRALGAGADGIAYLLDGRTLAVIGNSVVLAVAVVTASVLIGVPFAWLTARTDLPFRRFWLIAGLLTLVIPSYIGAITYIAAFGPRGFLQQLLAPLGISEIPSIYGFTGAWLSITLFTYPYVVLPVRAALLNLDPALEESARSLGLNRWAIFRRVTLPQLRPALVAGMLLSALYTLSDFGAVSLMKYNAFTRAIYGQYTNSFDREQAAILSLVLVLLTVALLFATRRLSTGRRNYRIGTGAQRRLRPLRLGRWRIPALVFCGLLVGVGTVVPVGVLLWWLTLGQGAVGNDLLQPMLNTVSVSGATALVVVLAALPIAWLSARRPSAFNRRLRELSYLGNGLPGLVIALALVFFAAHVLPFMYQTLPVLILGYAIRFLPLSVGATHSAFTQINPCLEEAGRSLGLGRWQVLQRITVPMARAGLLAGGALVFLSVMKELPTTLLLSPTGFETFATHIWTAQKEVNFAGIAAPALLLLAVSALSLVLMLRQETTE